MSRAKTLTNHLWRCSIDDRQIYFIRRNEQKSNKQYFLQSTSPWIYLRPRSQCSSSRTRGSDRDNEREEESEKKEKRKENDQCLLTFAILLSISRNRATGDFFLPVSPCIILCILNGKWLTQPIAYDNDIETWSVFFGFLARRFHSFTIGSWQKLVPTD